MSTTRQAVELAVVSCMALTPFSSQAQSPTQAQIGDATRAWFALQAGNTASAPAQPMLGAEASRAYERYLKSFETSIPAHYGSSLEDGGRPSLDVNYHDSN